MKNAIVGLGEILWDVFPQGKVLGGAPANFAYHVSQFGLNGYAVSAIGKDELGAEIKQVLKEKKLKTLISEVDFPTGTVQVTLSGDGVPQYEICEGVAWDNIPFTDALKHLAQQTKAVCFGSLAQRNVVSHSTIKSFLDEVPKDSMKIFDINLRQHFYSRELIEESLNQCTMLKINEEEIAILTEMFGLSARTESIVVKHLIQHFQIETVVLTKGTDGSYVITLDETSYLHTPKVKVVDTVGAGDAFTGAFVASLLLGKNIREAHQKAVDISAFVCTQRGAMPEYVR
ncbi:MAG TPA: carbohydrate kinase [Paludibacter sp.]|jgi:fructokinase|nr:MAG: 2-dehydro-3-deoxygluconokinase [Bacteroidetes bacterium ADurb.Bin174]HQB27506.1 carbohydrate kinase [Paludibacter sp.]